MHRICVFVSALHVAWAVGSVRPCSAAVAPAPLIQMFSTDSQALKLEKAANVIPTARQITWQREETIAFIHFGVNTFTGREWGDGNENPDIFNPTQLNTDQWVAALKAAGMKKVILTVKHHDGFVLYPSRYTGHSVKNSFWRNGQGDVVRDLTNSLQRYGLRFGIYLSPADIHEDLPGGRFTNGSPWVSTQIPTLVAGDNRTPTQFFTYNLDDYNRYFMNQLYELMTEYGPVHELWFDGAPAVSGQTFNREAWFDLIHRLQPEAVIFHGDLRWNGNESGISRETEWSVIPLPNDPRRVWSGDLTATDLGSRTRIYASGMNWLYWYPAEADVSLHPGWFFHPNESPKSLAQLMDIYYKSVGRNSVLLLNVPPDTRGLLIDADVSRLAQFGQWVQGLFQNNLARGAAATATSVRNGDPMFGAPQAVDDNHDTAWRAADGTTTATLEFTMAAPVRFHTVMLGESLAVGQRVESFAVDVWDGSIWRAITTGTTIGYKRLLQVSPVEAQRVRVRILQSRAAPSLANFGLFMNGAVQPTATPTPTPTPTATPGGAFIEITPPGSAVTASTHDGNLPTNTVDNSLASRWSASGDGQWIKYDLGTVQTVAHVSIAVYNGNSRQNRFDLQVSSDNVNWANVITGGLTSGTTTAEEIHDFSDVSARWVRYLGHSATTSTFNSVTEVSLFAPRAAPVTPTPTATPSTPPPTPTPTATPNTIPVDITPGGAAVTASTHDGNLPANTVDNNLATRWSASGDGQWIRYDLGSTRTVTHVRIAFYNGNVRQARFDLQLSGDGVGWTNTLTGALSSGTTTAEQAFDFTDAAARYVRYVGHGNTANAWNSLTEVSIFGTSAAAP